MADAHSRRSSISADRSVVPGTLIYLILNVNACYSRWQRRTRTINNTRIPFLELFHSFVSILLAHPIIVVQNCNSSVNFTRFNILWPDYCTSLVYFLNGTSMINMLQCYHYPSPQNSENQLVTTKGRFLLPVSAIYFSATNITFEVNWNCL
jgi:hypothetical protein